MQAGFKWVELLVGSRVGSTRVGLLACAAVVVANISAGCTGKPPGPTELFGASKRVVTTPSQDVKVRVFVDSTMSMAGFVHQGLGPITNYSNLLQALADNLRDSLETHYFRLGADVKPLKLGSENESIHSTFVREALQAPFYTSGNTSLETRLELALSEGPDGLTVILSDLFQQGQAVSELVSAARAKVFQKGQTAGMLAVRSGFNGMVCDVLPPPSRRCFPYSSSNAEGGRPVYLVVLGSQADVTRLIEALSATLKSRGLVDVQTLLVPQAVGQLVVGPVTELTALTPDSRARPRADATSLDGFRVRESSGPLLVGSRRSFSLAPEPLVPELDLTRVETRARTVSGSGEVSGQTPVRLPLIRSSLRDEVVQDGRIQEWDVAMNILASPAGQWQAIEFDLVLPSGLAPEGALTLPSWVNSWDLPPLEVQRFIGNQRGDPLWNRTLRLRELIEGFYRAAAKETPNFQLARVFYYLRID